MCALGESHPAQGPWVLVPIRVKRWSSRQWRWKKNLMMKKQHVAAAAIRKKKGYEA
jgi:hypothetical protein